MKHNTSLIKASNYKTLFGVNTPAFFDIILDLLNLILRVNIIEIHQSILRDWSQQRQLGYIGNSSDILCMILVRSELLSGGKVPDNNHKIVSTREEQLLVQWAKLNTIYSSLVAVKGANGNTCVNRPKFNCKV